MLHSKYWLAGIVSGLLAACGGENPEPQTPESPPPAETSTPAPPAAAPTDTAPPAEQPSSAVPAPAPSDMTAQAPVGEPPPQPLTDGQIAAITDATNTGEIEQAKLAQKKSRNARVKKFANMMIQHHSQAKEQQASLLKKLNLTAADNQKSAALTDESNRLIESLKSLEAEEFDRAYMDAQVSEHQHVLDALDNDLIPNAKNAELKASLVEFRPRVESHLSEARDIQQILGGASRSVGSMPKTGGSRATNTANSSGNPAVNK